LLINTVSSFITHPDTVLESPLLLQDFTWYNQQDQATQSTVALFVKNAIEDANRHINEPTQLRISDRAHVDETNKIRLLQNQKNSSVFG